MWIGKSRNWLLLLSVLAATGCASLTATSTGRTPIPASLTQPCPPLDLLTEGAGPTVLRWALATVDAYADCAARHQKLVEAVR